MLQTQYLFEVSLEEQDFILGPHKKWTQNLFKKIIRINIKLWLPEDLACKGISNNGRLQHINVAQN
jgi:hypothetical protein